jgi:hypothetical protein
MIEATFVRFFMSHGAHCPWSAHCMCRPQTPPTITLAQMTSRTCIILWTALLLLTTVSADKKLAAPARRLMQLPTAPCTHECGSNLANFAQGPNTYSCLSCGFSSQSDCLARSSCKQVWAGLGSNYGGQDDLDAQLDSYCSILGCYLYGQ